MEKGGLHYILMADIISSRTKKGEELIQSFKTLVQRVNSDQKESLLSPLTITLGDEFQGISQNLKSALETILLLEELRIQSEVAFNLNYVLHYGKIDTPINKIIAHEMLGEGLTMARETLNSIKSQNQRFHISLYKRPKLEEQLNLAFILYQDIRDSWKKKDSNILELFISELNYREVAKKTGKDTSLMWRRRKSLRITEFFAIKKLIMLIIENQNNN